MNETAEEVLREIATMPLSKDWERDQFGEIKSGSQSYGPAWAAWYFQERAKKWLRASGK